MPKIRIASDVLFQQLDDEAVLLHLPTEKYFGLNEVGCRVWRLLENGATVEETVDQIQAEYDAPERIIRQDVADLVEQLVKRDLIQIEA